MGEEAQQEGAGAAVLLLGESRGDLEARAVRGFPFEFSGDAGVGEHRAQRPRAVELGQLGKQVKMSDRIHGQGFRLFSGFSLF